MSSKKNNPSMKKAAPAYVRMIRTCPTMCTS